MNKPKATKDKPTAQNLTLLDEFEKNVEAFIGVLENNASLIDQWIKNLPKFSGTRCRSIPQKTRDLLCSIALSFCPTDGKAAKNNPIGDFFPDILRYLTQYIPRFKDKIEKQYNGLRTQIVEIVRLCGEDSLSPPSEPVPPYAKMSYLKDSIEELTNDLRYCAKMAREELVAEKLTEPEQAYTGKEAWKKFIEKLSEVGNLEIPLYPFKAGKIQYLNFTNKPGYLKYGAYRFSKDDSDVIENTVGFPLTIPMLRAFLVKNCSVQDPIDYSWPDIIAALSLYRNDLASLKPVGTEQTTPPAKRWWIPTCIGKIFEKVLYIFTKSFWDAVLERLSPK